MVPNRTSAVLLHLALAGALLLLAAFSSTGCGKKGKNENTKNDPSKDLDSVSFSGTNHALVLDDGGDIGAPQWQRTGTPHAVVYTRKKKMKVSATFRVNPPPGASTPIKAKGATTVNGDGGMLITLPELSFNHTGGQIVTYAPTDADVAFEDKIQFLNTLDIKWELKIGGGPYEEIGTSKNKAYITWADPLGGPTIQTAIDVGCKAAAGQTGPFGTDDHKVLQKIWEGPGGFKGLKVKRAEKRVPILSGVNYTDILSYYGFYDKKNEGDNAIWDPAKDQEWNHSLKCFNAVAKSLIREGNGQCSSWADLMIKVLEAQGLSKINGGDLRKYVFIAPDTDTVPKMYSFAIAEWATNPAAAPNGGWLIVSGNAGVDGESPVIPGLNQAADKKGIPGQGNSPNPQSAFENHYIVKINGEYYDPSYGKGPFSGANPLLDYDMAAFVGWIEVKTKTEYYLHPRLAGTKLCTYAEQASLPPHYK